MTQPGVYLHAIDLVTRKQRELVIALPHLLFGPPSFGFSSTHSSPHWYCPYRHDFPKTENDNFICLENIAYNDFGTRIPKTSKRECAQTCYNMPNCRVFEIEGDDCVVRYGNGTAHVRRGSKACVEVSTQSL